MQNLHIATIVIIAANVIISMIAFKDFSFFEKYKFNIAGIRRGEQVRMLTSGFLHADYSHLLFNMLTLYFFADTVVDELGTGKFFVVYVLSLIAGNLLSFYFHKDEYHYSAVGASGAVMGVLYSSILFDPMSRIYFMPAFVFGILYLLYSIYGMKKRIGNIGHDAHFGGAIAGYVITLILAPGLFKTSLFVVGMMAIPIVVLFVLYKLGKL